MQKPLLSETTYEKSSNLQKDGQKIALDVQKTVSVILYPNMPYIHHYVLHSQAAAGSICVLYTYYV